MLLATGLERFDFTGWFLRYLLYLSIESSTCDFLSRQVYVEPEHPLLFPVAHPLTHLPPPSQVISRKEYLEINGVLESAAVRGEHSPLEALAIPCPRRRRICSYVT